MIFDAVQRAYRNFEEATEAFGGSEPRGTLPNTPSDMLCDNPFDTPSDTVSDNPFEPGHLEADGRGCEGCAEKGRALQALQAALQGGQRGAVEGTMERLSKAFGMLTAQLAEAQVGMTRMQEGMLGMLEGKLQAQMAAGELEQEVWGMEDEILKLQGGAGLSTAEVAGWVGMVRELRPSLAQQDDVLTELLSSKLASQLELELERSDIV